jgi:hypothetical protein
MRMQSLPASGAIAGGADWPSLVAAPKIAIVTSPRAMVYAWIQLLGQSMACPAITAWQTLKSPQCWKLISTSTPGWGVFPQSGTVKVNVPLGSGTALAGAASVPTTAIHWGTVEFGGLTFAKAGCMRATLKASIKIMRQV